MSTWVTCSEILVLRRSRRVRWVGALGAASGSVVRRTLGADRCSEAVDDPGVDSSPLRLDAAADGTKLIPSLNVHSYFYPMHISLQTWGTIGSE